MSNLMTVGAKHNTLFQLGFNSRPSAFHNVTDADIFLIRIKMVKLINIQNVGLISAVSTDASEIGNAFLLVVEVLIFFSSVIFCRASLAVNRTRNGSGTTCANVRCALLFSYSFVDFLIAILAISRKGSVSRTIKLCPTFGSAALWA